MLSITGMTLDQFSDLMAGLGYKGERGEREKVKAAAVPAPIVETDNANPIPEEASPLAEAEAAQTVAAPELEAFVIFTWAPRPRAPRPERGPRAPRDAAAPRGEGATRDAQPRGEGRPRGDRPQGERKAEADAKPQGDRRPGKPHDRRDAKPGGKPGGKPHDGKPSGKHGKPAGKRDDSPRSFEAHPPRKERFDPDSPFAILAALRDKK